MNQNTPLLNSNNIEGGIKNNPKPNRFPSAWELRADGEILSDGLIKYVALWKSFT